MPKILVENHSVNLIPYAENMPDKETPRSIRFPAKLWKAIDEDAKRCKRSAVKQLEAILSLYYDLSDVEINKSIVHKTKDHMTASNVEALNAFKYSTEMDKENAALKDKHGEKTSK